MLEGVWRSCWTSQEHSWTEAQKQKPVAGLRILEYVLYNGAREPVRARGQWWKTNTSLAEEESWVVLETVPVKIMTVFGNKNNSGCLVSANT